MEKFSYVGYALSLNVVNKMRSLFSDVVNKMSLSSTKFSAVASLVFGRVATILNIFK